MGDAYMQQESVMHRRVRWMPGGARRLLVACVCVLGSLAAAAQTKPFTVDGFRDEVEAMFTGVDRREGRAFMETVFDPMWSGTYYEAPRRTRIVAVSNAMLKKRFDAFPHFRDLFTTLASFSNGGRAKDEFDAWLGITQDLVERGRKNNAVSFIEMCVGLFRDNTIYNSPSTTWRSRSSAFSFANDPEPMVVFSETDLLGLAKGDSTVVRGTRGVYYPAREIWEGVGGTLTWERAGLKPTATFAEWAGPYTIRMKNTSFEVDSVRFHDPYFERSLFGQLQEKVLANVTPEKASYPRFSSYDRRMHIRDIVEGIDFEGGFTMEGAKLQGYGTREEPAFLTFYRDQRPFIITQGLFYSIEPERISSQDVSVRILLDKDSIHHPSTSLRFMRDKKTLSLIKKDEGLSKGPFYDTFHKLDMYFEMLTWKQGEPLVRMGNLLGSTQTSASFESFDYFKERRYMALMGMSSVHPLPRLRDFARSNGDVFDARAYAGFVRIPYEQLIPEFIDLTNKGFITFDPEAGTIEVRPRLAEHIQAMARKRDYDVLQFNSTSDDGVNAVLNLLNNDLTISGVARIVVSDSQDVRIFPSERTVVVKKDRDFTFGGMVQAGKLRFHGKEYYFHYDPFVVDLLNVDSVSFYADHFDDEPGDARRVLVKNVLESVTGTLEIDAPSNKSGILADVYPQYPRFNSTKESFVYYDRSTIQQGVYNRDRFYFKSDPFELDSLNKFTNAGLFFPGTLHSGGIFPDLRETLRLQQDYALGFVRPTGSEGMPLYGNKARFRNDIRLDHNGLQGDGDLEYLTTALSSRDLVFCPDSTFGMADKLTNAGQRSPMKVPAVEGEDLFVRLEPGNDLLLSEFRVAPMRMYAGDADLYGSTVLTPKGMKGSGLVDFGNATLRSNLFAFETMSLRGDTSDFRLTEGDTASIAFRTDNVNAHVKLDERVGEFVSNGTETRVEFPVNRYVCYMDRFKWFMDDGDIELESDRTAADGSQDLQLAGSNFISTHPDQDSLSFMAPKARYDLKRHLITADEVRYIQVADALISPDSSRIRVRRNAAMDPLNNAGIVANYVTRHHTIYNATVNIKARRNYEATGTVDYLDENNRRHPIRLESIRVDSTYQTYARGRVTQEEGFQLSPAFDYFGEVLLEANIKGYTFTGSTRIQHGCNKLARNWMRFSGTIDPAEVFIPVGDTLFDADGFVVGAGIYLSKSDPYQAYGTFLSAKENKADGTVIAGSGLLYYDKARKAYVISNKDKIRQRDLPGQLVSLSVEDCRVETDGTIHSGMDFGRVDITSVGAMTHVSDSNITRSEQVMFFDFHFLDNALDRMVSEIASYPEQTQVDISRTHYLKSMRELLGLERSDKLISELTIKGEIKRLPDELQRTLVLADVRMRWDDMDESWVSEGPIGIATVGKKSVFRYVKGKIQLERKRSGDVMNVLLMLDDQTYWYFQYTRNYLYAYSSDKQFNEMIGELKDDKRKLEAKKDQPAYQFILTNKRKVEDFRDRFGI
jgi:hypothetical protein